MLRVERVVVEDYRKGKNPCPKTKIGLFWYSKSGAIYTIFKIQIADTLVDLTIFRLYGEVRAVIRWHCGHPVVIRGGREVRTIQAVQEVFVWQYNAELERARKQLRYGWMWYFKANNAQ